MAFALVGFAFRAGLGRRWSEALRSPWTYGLAGLLGLFIASAHLNAEDRDRSVSAEAFVGSPPPGFTYARLSGADGEQIERLLSREGGDRSDVAVRRILRSGSPVGLVMFFNTSRDELDDTARDFRDAGGTLREETVAGQRAFVGRAQGARVGFVEQDENITGVAAPDRATVRELLDFYARRE